MKALWQNELYVVVETHHATIELEPIEGTLRLHVSLADDRLIIDPTDGELEEAELARQPGHCCDCPHESYLTTSVSRHEHRCRSCGETFVDAHRTKRYFGHAPA